MNLIKSLLGVFVFSLLVLSLPTSASAQWGGNNRRDRDRDRDDDYYGRNGGYNNYGLRDTVRRLKRDTRDFVNFVDNALDRSRYDGTDYEDRINDLAKDFRNAADRLESRYDDRDLYRSQNEAQNVINLANRLDRELRRVRLGYDIDNYWNNLQRQVSEISNAYRGRGRGNNRNNGGWGDWRNRFPF
jgi:hypothetical protein